MPVSEASLLSELYAPPLHHHPWKNCLPRYWALVPKMWGTPVINDMLDSTLGSGLGPGGPSGLVSLSGPFTSTCEMETLPQPHTLVGMGGRGRDETPVTPVTPGPVAQVPSLPSFPSSRPAQGQLWSRHWHPGRSEGDGARGPC